MDRIIQKVAMSMARSATRRDFMSRAVRSIVGVGLGASFVFGGASYALAAPPCDARANNGCSGGNSWCTSSGDVNGCYMDNPVPYCGDCAYDNQGNITGCSTNGGNSGGYGSWFCCCNGEMSECTDCGPPGQGYQCVCNSKHGACPTR